MAYSVNTGYFTGTVSANENLLETIKTDLIARNPSVLTSDMKIVCCGFSLICDSAVTIKINEQSEVVTMPINGSYYLNVSGSPNASGNIGADISKLVFSDTTIVTAMNYYWLAE